VDAEDARSIGARARMIRRRRGLSLDVVAGLAGITKTYLSMLELGQRGFNRRGLIEDLANALGCSVADLTGQPYLPSDRGTADALAALPEIGMALSDTTLDDVPDVPARPVEQLVRLVDQANDHSDQAHFALSGRGLGALLTCRVAFTTAKYLGQPTIALLAGRRGYDAAQRLGNPALIGFAVCFRANALMRQGARGRTTQLVTAGIETLAGLADPTSADPATAEAYGMLHLHSALNAARARRAADARDHLAEAEAIARRTGERNTLRLHFGPTNTAVWSVAVSVELEDGQAAYDRATVEPINVHALGSANRIATLHLTLHARSRRHKVVGTPRRSATWTRQTASSRC
jgi:transcriptional regulator with XRE-family HTH domain